MKKMLITASLVASVSLAVVSCDSNSSDGAAPTPAAQSPSAETPLTTFRSPSKFDGSPIRIDASLKPAPDTAAVVSGKRGFIATKAGISAFDLATGMSPWSADIGGANDNFSANMYPTAPVVSDDGKHVFTAVSANQPGSGTTKARSGVKVVAVDTSTGSVTEVGFVQTESAVAPTKLVASGNVVVVSLGDELSSVLGAMESSSITAFDASAHRQLWQLKGSAAPYIVDGAVLAVAKVSDGSRVTYPQLVSVDVNTGVQRWTSGNDEKSSILEATGVGLSTGEVATTVTGFGDKKKRTEIRDASTGVVKRTVSGVELTAPVRDSSTVFDLGKTVGAFDGATLQPKWTLPTSTRNAPSDPILFGGLIYGGVGSNESVIVDGTSGADKISGIRGRVLVVSEYGIVIQDSIGLAFLPATG